MSAYRLRFAATVVAIGVITATGSASNNGAQATAKPQKVEILPDTLPPYQKVRGASRDKAGHVAAATDALQGDFGLPAPLVLNRYRREGRSVVVDMKADSLPQIRWENAGGTVRILAVGRRILLARHK